MKWLCRIIFFVVAFWNDAISFLRPTLSCMLHPHQPSKVGMMLQSCHGDMVLKGHVVGESYKHANRLVDFRIFWDCWNVRNTILRLEIHVHQKSQPPSDSWAWVCLTFHRMHFHNYWSWDLLENPNDWPGCVGCAHLHADHLLGRGGGEWGLSWWSCRSIRILEAKNTKLLCQTIFLIWTSSQHCPVHAGFSGAFSFLLPRRGWRSGSGLEQKVIWCPFFDKCFQIVQVSHCELFVFMHAVNELWKSILASKTKVLNCEWGYRCDRFCTRVM